MVCRDCESKLSKVIVPDKWKAGAQNVERRGGYKNSLLQVRGASQRFLAGNRTCRICKQKVAQDAHYCQDCAHHNGICAMCGKRVDDLRFDRRSLAQPLKRHARDEYFEGGGGGGGDYGTSERLSKRVREEVQEEVPDARSEALEMAQSGLARASGRVLGEDRSSRNKIDGAPRQEEEVKSRDDDDPYAGWASAKDVASGRIYYFNAKTKETSWLWPPATLTKRGGDGDAKQNAGAPFLPSASFQGRREGYIFTTRPRHGTGYYLDDKSR